MQSCTMQRSTLSGFTLRLLPRVLRLSRRLTPQPSPMGALTTEGQATEPTTGEQCADCGVSTRHFWGCRRVVFADVLDIARSLGIVPSGAVQITS